MDQPRASVLICSDIASHLESKNLTFIEAFDALASLAFPSEASFFAVAKVWGLAEDRTHDLHLRLMAPGGVEMVRAGEHRITPAREVQVHTAVSRFASISFPRPGLYEVQAVLAGAVIGAVPLQINQVTGS
ncbi:MAG: DUF6941 family protein [Bacillota bacterium]